MNRETLLSGLVVAALGFGALLQALQYELGSPSRMGPGFFPALLAGIAIFLGLAILVQGLRADKTQDEKAGMGAAVRPVLVILGSIALFGLLIVPFGLVPALVTCVLVSTFASGRPSLRRVIALSLGVPAACVLIFLYGLDLSIPIATF